MTEQDQQRTPTADAAGQGAVPPPRPIPDLGFFAGAPQLGGSGGSSQFGGAPAPTSQFGGPPAATSQFGPAPSPFSTAPSQFGTAPAPFGSPAPTNPGVPASALPGPQGPLAALRSTPGGRWALRIGIGLAISLMFGLFGVGRFGGLDLFGRGITVPDSLGGQPAVTDEALLAEAERRASGVAPLGVDLEIGLYGSAGLGTAFIGVKYDDETPTASDVVAMLASTSGGADTRQVGANACTQMPGAQGALCVRVEDGLVVAVASGGAMEDVSALTDEAWAAQ